ncbi:restriction endonuclease [Pseudoalteromonas sp. S3776]|uniref:restriction endonuclease subunit S n=1 Tax=Pseudoalteromonas sp. S3776 TaxID=579544 RepID=UPI00110819B7|nr:restriction endonuclease subunit S [Pseudoalteromonas sp. S3776]TMO79970.1 restriction endonuclease [Pseudoalteromonas sp. S3776]
MNDFSYVEKLLDGVEVVWFPISEVTQRTTNIKWRETSESHQYIALTSVSVDTKKIIETTEIKASNAPSRAQKLVKKDDVLFATTRPTQMRYCLIDEEYNGAVASTGYCVLRVKRDVTLPKWILHLISSSDFKKYLEENQSGSAYPAISDAKVKGFSIPIPCPNNPEKSLEIQAEIVRILDAFTSMTAELTTELTTELNLRKKQYNYYRDQLFAGSGFKLEKLGEISKIYLGLTYTPKYVEKGVKFISAKNTSKDFLDLADTKYISEEEYLSSTSNAKPKRGDVLFTRVGSNLGHPVIVETDEPLCMFVSLGYIRVNPAKVLNSYIKHWMNTALFWDQVEKHTYGAAKVNLNTGWLNKFDVLLPSLEEQTRIIEILDKFEVLTTSIQEGLPREIKLRQKQYEYYRDLLLSYPKPHSDEAA